MVGVRARAQAARLDCYSEAIELYFRPGLGYVRLAELRDRHFRDLYAAMLLINRPGDDDALGRVLARAARGAR